MDKSRPGARRPVRSWGIKAPQNSLKTPENSRKSSQLQEAGILQPGATSRDSDSKLRNSRKKTKVSAIFVFHLCQEAPGARRATFGIKSQKTPKNFLRCILTCFQVKVYIPGRDTNNCSEELERAEMLDFLLGILIPLKLLLLAWAAWQLLGWLLG